MLFDWLLFCALFQINLIISAKSETNASKEYSVDSEECNFDIYKNGCKHNEGFVCVDNTCVCEIGYALDSSGICLPTTSQTIQTIQTIETTQIEKKCHSSDQCLRYDINSLCLASNNDFDEWLCLCKHDFYYDRHKTRKCLKKLSFGENCSFSDQCLTENGVCNAYNRCDCRPNHYFDQLLNECKHNDSLKCSQDQEWNRFTHECQIKVYYSHKGGGRGGGGRGGGRGGGGHRGGGSYSKGRSYWFIYSGGGHGGYSGYGGGGYGSGYNGEKRVDWVKVTVVVVAVLCIMMACCYCSYKFRQQDKEAEIYWRNRSNRTIPRIVIRGADDVSSPLLQPIGPANQRRASSTSVANASSPQHRSRSRSPSTHSQREFRVAIPAEQSVPCSPPPSYSSIMGNASPILPFASNPSPNPNPTLPFATDASSRQRSPSLTRPQSPRPEQRAISSNNIIFQSPGDPNSINSVNNEQPIVTHPENPNLILPFATSAPKEI